MSFSDYRDLSCWLGCYGYDPQQDRTFSEIDTEIHKHLTNNTNLTLSQVFDKLLFMKSLNHGFKKAAFGLILGGNLNGN